MDKQVFISQYADHIRCYLNYSLLVSNDRFSIHNEPVRLEDMLKYFVPRFEKNGIRDMNGIEAQVLDPLVKPVTLLEAAYDPKKWDLTQNSDLPLLDSFRYFVLATDSSEDPKTLILDSNHTLVNLVNNRPDLRKHSFGVLRIFGTDMEEIIPDFYVLKGLNQ